MYFIYKVTGNEDHARSLFTFARTYYEQIISPSLPRSSTTYRTFRRLADGTEIEFIKIFDEIRLVINSPFPEGAEFEKEEEEEGETGIFYVLLNDGNYQFFSVKEAQEGPLEVSATPSFQSDEDIIKDLPHASKSYEIEGVGRVLVTDTGNIYLTEEKEHLNGSLLFSVKTSLIINSKYRILKSNNLFVWYLLLPTAGHIVVARLNQEPGAYSFELISSKSINTDIIPNSALTQIPTFVYRDCFANYWSANKNVGRNVDIGHLTTQVLADNGEYVSVGYNLKNMLDNGDSKIESYFTYVNEIEGLSGCVNEVLSVSETAVEVILLTNTRLREFEEFDDKPCGKFVPPGGYLDQYYIMSPRFVRVKFSLMDESYSSLQEDFEKFLHPDFDREGFTYREIGNHSYEKKACSFESSETPHELNCGCQPANISGIPGLFKSWVLDYSETTQRDEVKVENINKVSLVEEALPLDVSVKGVAAGERLGLEGTATFKIADTCPDLEAINLIRNSESNPFVEWVNGNLCQISGTYAGTTWTYQGFCYSEYVRGFWYIPGAGWNWFGGGNSGTIWATGAKRVFTTCKPFYTAPLGGIGYDLNHNRGVYFVANPAPCPSGVQLNVFWHATSVIIPLDVESKIDEAVSLLFTTKKGNASAPSTFNWYGDIGIADNMVQKSTLEYEKRGQENARPSLTKGECDKVSHSERTSKESDFTVGMDMDFYIKEKERTENVLKSLDLQCGAAFYGNTGSVGYSVLGSFAYVGDFHYEATQEGSTAYFLDNRASKSNNRVTAHKTSNGEWRVLYTSDDNFPFGEPNDITDEVFTALGVNNSSEIIAFGMT